MPSFQDIAFIGLGVMGEPMCRNIARKSGARVTAFDLSTVPLERLSSVGVETAATARDAAAGADLVLMSLPSGKEVEAVCLGKDGLVAAARPGQAYVDLGTSPPALARRIAAALAEKGALFADAPVARTRQAAEDGTLSIMVGADADVFARIQPILACCGSEVTHCGGIGAGQVVKILNNMVLSETVMALAEGAASAQALGVENVGLTVGASADIVALDRCHPAFVGRDGDALLDGWLFAVRAGAIRSVWRRGQKMVDEGRHTHKEDLIARFRRAMSRVLQE